MKVRTVVLISDGNSEHVAHALIKKCLFEERKIRVVTAVINVLKQIKYERLLLTCAPFSEIPFSMSTMVRTVRLQFVLSRGGTGILQLCDTVSLPALLSQARNVPLNLVNPNGIGVGEGEGAYSFIFWPTYQLQIFFSYLTCGHKRTKKIYKFSSVVQA